MEVEELSDEVVSACKPGSIPLVFVDVVLEVVFEEVLVRLVSEILAVDNDFELDTVDVDSEFVFDEAVRVAVAELDVVTELDAAFVVTVVADGA